MSARGPGPTRHWERIGRPEDVTTLLLIDGEHLIVRQGATTILESLALYNAAEWLECTTKSDDAAFLIKRGGANGGKRAFRVRFANGEAKCRECAEKLRAASIPVKIAGARGEVGSQLSQRGGFDFSQEPLPPPPPPPPQRDVDEPGIDSATLPSYTIRAVAEHVVDRCPLPPAYCAGAAETGYPDRDDDDVGTLVRLCLTDPSFPSFVEKVEEAMKEIMSGE